MEKIVSKRHKGYFYLSLILGSLFILAIATLALATYTEGYKNGTLKPKQTFLPLVSIGAYIFTIYLVYCYFRNVPIFSVDNEEISIGKNTYHWKDATNIQLSGKQPFRCFGNFNYESTTITFNDNITNVFFDDFYSNSAEIKSFIDSVIINKREVVNNPVLPIDESDVANSFYDEFKGNQFTSYRGLMMWGLIGFISFMCVHNFISIPIGFTFGIFAFASFFFFIFSSQMNFFLLSKDYLIIKNHNLLWKKNIYRLSDIREIILETKDKQPYSLRVVTKEYKTKLFQAGTLRDKNWLVLKDTLDGYGVNVRNELPI